MNYPYSLPKLEYAYNALEPHIDAKTMEIHYTKHHQAYIDNLNKAVERYPALYSVQLEELLAGLIDLPQDIQLAVRNHGGGHWNHTFFWTVLTRDSKKKPVGKIEQAIVKTFGSFDAFKEQFSAHAKTVFGSGWAWLCVDQKGTLSVSATPNQDCPIMKDLTPLLGLDVWEHAYYLKYQNKRPDYIESWWNVVNWDMVEKYYQETL